MTKNEKKTACEMLNLWLGIPSSIITLVGTGIALCNYPLIHDTISRNSVQKTPNSIRVFYQGRADKKHEYMAHDIRYFVTTAGYNVVAMAQDDHLTYAPNTIRFFQAGDEKLAQRLNERLGFVYRKDGHVLTVTNLSGRYEASKGSIEIWISDK